jgi:hypothetical protein
VDGKKGIMKLRLLLAATLVLGLTAPAGVQAQEKKTLTTAVADTPEREGQR